MTISSTAGYEASTAGPAPRGGSTTAASEKANERARYAVYRRQQARALINLMPQEAVRPLYRRGLREGRIVPDKDPLGALVTYCETILPLPSFEVWQEDVARNPDAHLESPDDFRTTPTAAAPATLEARAMTRHRSAWTARLKGFREGGAWRGFIAFEDAESGAVHHTTLIFCEAGPMELRDRFLGFENRALEAFLRSTCP